MSIVLSGEQMTLPVWIGAFSCLSLDYSARLTPWSWQVQSSVRYTTDENQNWGGALSEERTDTLLKPVACCAPRSSIHKADAALAGGRAVLTTILVLAVDSPRRKCSEFLDLIGSIVVAVPANKCRIYMNETCTIWR